MRTGRPPKPGNLKKPHKCKTCGDKFTAYTDRHRVYCSKNCFYADSASRCDPERKRVFECEHCRVQFTAPREDRRFCSKRCSNLVRTTKGLGQPGNRRYMTTQGYILVSSDGSVTYRPEHDVIMEKALGRSLHRHETVHHRNLDRSDNRLENLQLKIGQHGKGTPLEDLIADKMAIQRALNPWLPCKNAIMPGTAIYEV